MTDRKKDTFQEYCDILTDSVCHGQSVSVELMDAFLGGFAGVIFEDRAMPENFYRLASKAVLGTGYTDAMTVSPDSVRDIVYALASIARIRMENSMTRKQEEQVCENRMAMKIITIIGQKGRIRHRELAQRLGITPEELTKYLGQNDYSGLIMAYRPGREKIYLLTDRGQALLKQT